MRSEIMLSDTFDDVYQEIDALIKQKKEDVKRVVNDAMVSLYWRIGKRLAEEITGVNKPEYGKRVVLEISKRLSVDYGSGFDKPAISRMINFYQEFPDYEKVVTGNSKCERAVGFDMPLNEIDKGVTVRQLLNHTSGVPDYFDESVMEEYEELWIDYPNYKIRHNSDLLPLFINKPMMYPKGEKFQYNNTGYILLAMIIEKTTGMYFDQYLKENVFDICGMKSTGYYELDRLPAKCANNYIYCVDTKDFRTNIFSVDVKGTGAGGAFVTVRDIISFWTNLLEENLISKAFVSNMLSKQSGDGDDAEEGYYGYGMWIIDNPNGIDFAYFQGCDPGVSFISEYNPNSRIISVLVSNYGDNVWREMRKIREVLY